MPSRRLLIRQIAITSESSKTHIKICTKSPERNPLLNNPRPKDYGSSLSSYIPSKITPSKPWWTPAAHSHAFGKTHGMPWRRQKRTMTLNIHHPEGKLWEPRQNDNSHSSSCSIETDIPHNHRKILRHSDPGHDCEESAEPTLLRPGHLPVQTPIPCTHQH